MIPIVMSSQIHRVMNILSPALATCSGFPVLVECIVVYQRRTTRGTGALCASTAATTSTTDIMETTASTATSYISSRGISTRSIEDTGIFIRIGLGWPGL